MVKRPRRPRDPNQLAKLIVDLAMGEAPRDPERVPESPLIEVRRKGGKARGRTLSARKRREIAWSSQDHSP